MEKLITKMEVTTKVKCLMAKRMERMEYLYLVMVINFKANLLMTILNKEFILLLEAYNIRASLKEIKKMEREF
jgi:hypothetical protein